MVLASSPKNCENFQVFIEMPLNYIKFSEILKMAFFLFDMTTCYVPRLFLNFIKFGKRFSIKVKKKCKKFQYSILTTHMELITRLTVSGSQCNLLWGRKGSIGSGKS